MKTTKTLILTTMLLATWSVALVSGCACCGGKCNSKSSSSMSMQAKPYPLDTCVVCDTKFGTEKAIAFNYQGQEIKVCDAAEKAEFDKTPDKYMKKLAAVEK